MVGECDNETELVSRRCIIMFFTTFYSLVGYQVDRKLSDRCGSGLELAGVFFAFGRSVGEIGDLILVQCVSCGRSNSNFILVDRLRACPTGHDVCTIAISFGPRERDFDAKKQVLE